MTRSATASSVPAGSALDAPRRNRAEPSAAPRATPWAAAACRAVALSAYFLVVYGGCNWLASRRPHVGTWYYSWEHVIPFVPAMIVPYVSIDLFFFFSPFLCRRRGELRAHARRILLAITVAGLCFLLFPLQMGTVHPPVGGFFGVLFTALGGFDRPYNLVPSLHIALLAILWPVYVRHTRGVTRLLVRAWFTLIAASTLLTAQHHVVDLVAGFALGVLCLALFPYRPGNLHGTIPPPPNGRPAPRAIDVGDATFSVTRPSRRVRPRLPPAS